MSKYRDSLPKKDTLTPAQVIFQGKDLLVGRPPEMNFQDYKMMRGVQSKVLQKLTANAPDRKIQALMKRFNVG